jgi:UDP-N-acetylmuramoyl-tripeptide--D-alanyl-D-alanine ligase
MRGADVPRTLAQFTRDCGGVLHGADAPFAEVLIDSRRIGRGDLFCALPGTRVDGHGYVAAAAAAGAAGALVARQVDAPIAQVVVADVAAAMAAAARAVRARYAGAVVGVAGSNGKTTTKEMLAAILAQRGRCLATRGNLNNELGVPLTLLRLGGSDAGAAGSAAIASAVIDTAVVDSAVIEMGANHSGDVAALCAIASPGIGLVTNAGAEHLEGFGSLEGVARAEGEMFAALPADGVAVLNVDDDYAPLWRSMARARVVGFGLGAQADVRATDVRLEASADGFRTRFRLVLSARAIAPALVAGAGAGATPAGQGVDISLALAGSHNVHNALAAAAAALAAGATLAQVADGLALMQPVEGRLQLKRGAHDAWLIDDTYNANPSSVRAALEMLAALPGRRWLVLGDMAELGAHAESSHREAGALARASGVERLWAYGSLAALAADSFGTGAARSGDLGGLATELRPQLAADVRLLVKGSRVNRLERLVAALQPGGAGAPAAH